VASNVPGDAIFALNPSMSGVLNLNFLTFINVPGAGITVDSTCRTRWNPVRRPESSRCRRLGGHRYRGEE